MMEVAPERAETMRAVRPSRSWLLRSAPACSSSRTIPGCWEKHAVASAVQPLPSRTSALAPASSSTAAKSSWPDEAAHMSMVPSSSSSTALTSPPASRYARIAAVSAFCAASSMRAGSRGRVMGASAGALSPPSPVEERFNPAPGAGRRETVALDRSADARPSSSDSSPPATECCSSCGRVVHWLRLPSSALDPRDVSSLDEEAGWLWRTECCSSRHEIK
mmetsp:Transcript_27709/g.89529  ORF Transcript_27709/g.89529 Transcript_27709/m.89529 type:complete len:220 (+) Transcript_27709:343-1002(+)